MSKKTGKINIGTKIVHGFFMVTGACCALYVLLCVLEAWSSKRDPNVKIRTQAGMARIRSGIVDKLNQRIDEEIEYSQSEYSKPQ